MGDSSAPGRKGEVMEVETSDPEQRQSEGTVSCPAQVCWGTRDPQPGAEKMKKKGTLWLYSLGALCDLGLYPLPQIIFSHLKSNPEITIPEYRVEYSLQCFLLLFL